MRRSIPGFAIAIVSAGWLIAQPAAAQNQPPTRSAPGAAATKSNISDEKIDQAAAAIQDMQKVRSDYQQKLAGASPDQQTQIAGEANAAMEKAVTAHGLSVDEYNSIIQLAQNDSTVRDRIMKRLGAPGKQ
jgi:hypothetical protein